MTRKPNSKRKRGGANQSAASTPQRATRRPRLRLVPAPTPEPRYSTNFNIGSLIYTLKDPAFVIAEVEGAFDHGVADGDLLILDRGERTPRRGELIVNQRTDGSYSISVSDGRSHIRDAADQDAGSLHGVCVYVVRRLRAGVSPWEAQP